MFHRWKIALIGTLLIASWTPTASAEGLREVCRFLGLGWGDGYQSQAPSTMLPWGHSYRPTEVHETIPRFEPTAEPTPTVAPAAPPAPAALPAPADSAYQSFDW